MQVAEGDAVRYGVREGDWARVRSRTGGVEVRVRVGGIEPGQVFVPFHFGYWDAQDGRARAANELTPSVWDAVSKQPQLKGGVVRIENVEEGGGGEGKGEGEGVRIHRRARTGQELKEEGEEEVKEQQRAAIDRAQHKGEGVQQQQGTRHQHVVDAVLSVVVGCELLLEVYERLMEEHAKEVEVRQGLRVLKGLAAKVQQLMDPLVTRYRGERDGEGEGEGEIRRRRGREEQRGRALVAALLPEGRQAGVSAPYALLRDLQAVWTLASAQVVLLSGLGPTSAALQDEGMGEVVRDCLHEMQRQAAWAQAKVKVKAPQTLIVPVEVQGD